VKLNVYENKSHYGSCLSRSVWYYDNDNSLRVVSPCFYLVYLVVGRTKERVLLN